MHTFDEPAYYLDLRHSLNRAALESAKRDTPMTILVRPENNPSAPPTKATGRLDGNEFHIEVVTIQGRQSHTWAWEFLCEALGTYRD
jgi:hypothetical protein